MDSPITLHDKTLAHLHRFIYISRDIQYGAPFDITQDGIAMKLGISRSHASIVISKMMAGGEVESSSSTIKKSYKMHRRKVYHLTNHGKEVYLARKNELLALGICIDEALDSTDNVISNLGKMTQYQMDMLGCYCLLEQTVTRSNFPSDIPLVYFRNDNNAYLRPELKAKILESAGPEMLMRWHSKAADWCIDHEDGISERIFHLVMARRDREAVRLIRDKRFILMDSPEAKVLDSLPILLERQDDTDLQRIAARMLIDSGRTDDAADIADRISLKDRNADSILKAEIALKQHRIDDAYSIITGIDGNDPDKLITEGVCLLWSGRPEEAMTVFSEAESMMSRDRCIFRMDILLAYESFALMEMGRNAEARMVLENASSISRNERRKADLRELCDRLFPIDSEDCILLESVDIRDVKVPDVLYVPLEHRKPLESESPCEHRGLDSEWRENLGPEHSCSSELHPLAVEEDLDLQ